MIGTPTSEKRRRTSNAGAAVVLLLGALAAVAALTCVGPLSAFGVAGRTITG